MKCEDEEGEKWKAGECEEGESVATGKEWKRGEWRMKKLESGKNKKGCVNSYLL
jgi:hypothetical protein